VSERLPDAREVRGSTVYVLRPWVGRDYLDAKEAVRSEYAWSPSSCEQRHRELLGQMEALWGCCGWEYGLDVEVLALEPWEPST